MYKFVMLRIKIKQHDPCSNFPSQNIKIKYQNYWADHILQRECQSVTYAKVSEGILDNMIHGFDSIILACGPHCSGKTFNIMGRNRKYEGIVPRLIDEMLAVRNHTEVNRGTGVAGGGGRYAMSCVEIKDNRIFDLLNSDSDRSCLMKDVSKYDIRSSKTAKQKLWEANAKRTVVRENKQYAPSHVYDFVITFYRQAPPTEEDDDENDQLSVTCKCAKVHIVEMAGVGPNNTQRPLKHQIQANQTTLEFSQFLKYVVNDNGVSLKDYGLITLTLLKYCLDVFSKQGTMLRVICHIRPELEFLKTNISVLKFGEALYKLTSNEIYLPSDETKATALLHKHMEHLAYELNMYRKFKGHKRMGEMTNKHYVELRNKVFDFMRFKIDDIVLPKWSYSDVFTVLSVFREYYNLIISSMEKNVEKTSHNESAPFPVKSMLVDNNPVRLTMEDTRRKVNEMLSGFDSNLELSAFLEDYNLLTIEQHKMANLIREAHRCNETSLGTLLDVQERLIKARDCMDKLRRKRHISGNEQYDQDMNVIVPAKERRMYRIVQRIDVEMARATADFFQSENKLNRTLDEYSKLATTIQDRYQEYRNNLIHSMELQSDSRKSIRYSKTKMNKAGMPKKKLKGAKANKSRISKSNMVRQ